VTGGVAYGSVHRQYSFGFPADAPIETTSGESKSLLQTGGVVGGGLEWAFMPRVTLRAEYLFVHLNGDTFSTTTTTGFCNSTPLLACNFNIRGNGTDEHSARLGLSYHFN